MYLEQTIVDYCTDKRDTFKSAVLRNVWLPAALNMIEISAVLNKKHRICGGCRKAIVQNKSGILSQSLCWLHFSTTIRIESTKPKHIFLSLKTPSKQDRGQISLIFIDKKTWADFKPALYHYSVHSICKWTMFNFPPWCLHQLSAHLAANVHWVMQNTLTSRFWSSAWDYKLLPHFL